MSFAIVNGLIGILAAEIIRFSTGRLFSEKEIKAISSHAIGKHFSHLLPTPEDELNAVQRVNEAQTHIAAAGQIISDMQCDLGKQSQYLNGLLNEIEEKKKIADKYAHLAKTNEAQFSAFKLEFEDVLRTELVRQSEKGRRVRQILSIILWLITLILGAGLGAYFKEITAWAGQLTF